MRFWKLLPLVIFGGLFGGISAQSLEVVPARIMADEAAAIRATGLEPNERVTIRAELTARKAGPRKRISWPTRKAPWTHPNWLP